MGWLAHSIVSDVRCTSNILLYCFIQRRKTSGSRRKLREHNLRCKQYQVLVKLTYWITAECLSISCQWFIGRELNPSIGSFDIKSFNELRPGLILWVLINVSMVCEQATRRRGFANVTDSMWLVLAFEAWYVADSLYNEVRQ